MQCASIQSSNRRRPSSVLPTADVEAELCGHGVGPLFGFKVQQQCAELGVDEHVCDRAMTLAEATAPTSVYEDDYPCTKTTTPAELSGRLRSPLSETPAV